jgi:hypothetical protein
MIHSVKTTPFNSGQVSASNIIDETLFNLFSHYFTIRRNLFLFHQNRGDDERNGAK